MEGQGELQGCSLWKLHEASVFQEFQVMKQLEGGVEVIVLAELRFCDCRNIRQRCLVSKFRAQKASWKHKYGAQRFLGGCEKLQNCFSLQRLLFTNFINLFSYKTVIEKKKQYATATWLLRSLQIVIFLYYIHSDSKRHLVKFLREAQIYYFYLISLMFQMNYQVKAGRSDFRDKPLANYVSFYNSGHKVICSQFKYHLLA